MVTFSAGQEAARRLLEGPQRFVCLAGGTRSGKTFLILRHILERALKGAGSRHALLRFHANAARASLALDTLPKVMRLCFPGVLLKEHRQDGFFALPNEARLILIALQAGAFDGCLVRRERAFLTNWSSPPIGAVTLFQGRVTTIDEIGRTSAEVTVASDLVLLDVQMPRNVYQPTCNHTLYDSGCGLVKNAFGSNGSVGAGVTSVSIPWSGASDIFTQGTLVFTSGVNLAITVGLKSGSAGLLTLAAPLRVLPAPGDTFTAYQGCDHTLATCGSKFNNAPQFRGFPFVPVPETAY